MSTQHTELLAKYRVNAPEIMAWEVGCERASNAERPSYLLNAHVLSNPGILLNPMYIISVLRQELSTLPCVGSSYHSYAAFGLLFSIRYIKLIILFKEISSKTNKLKTATLLSEPAM